MLHTHRHAYTTQPSNQPVSQPASKHTYRFWFAIAKQYGSQFETLNSVALSWLVSVAHSSCLSALSTTNRAHTLQLNTIVCTVCTSGFALQNRTYVSNAPYVSCLIRLAHIFMLIRHSHITKCVNTHYFRDFGKRVRAEVIFQ